MAIEQDMLDALIQHQSYSFRASTKVVNELQGEFVKSTNSISSRLRDLLDELTQSEIDALVVGRYTTDALKEVKTLFDELYSSVALSLPETFVVSATALAVYESTYINKLYGGDVELSGEKISNKALKTPITGGLLFDDVWRNLAESTRKKAMYTVREGLSNGLTTAQIVQEIKGKRTRQLDGTYINVGGIVEQTKRDIETNVRTIRSHVSNGAMVDTFDALGFDYLKFVSVIDGRSTKGCASLDQTVWKKGDPNIVYPPRHYNCRAILIGVDKDGKIDGKRPFVESDKPVSKIPKDQREGIIGQVDANKSFPEFFKTASSSFQKEWLGETRYKLYKEGNFPLSKFVDPLKREYTIAELKILDAATFERLGL